MGERDLILAIIHQAIEDSKTDVDKYQKETVRNVLSVAKSDALCWLNSESREFGSFCWYCNLIDIDPEWVRRTSKEWKRTRKWTGK